MTGKIDFLELFAGSARLSQVAAMNGLRVGQPIDLRTGFDILTSDGRKRTRRASRNRSLKSSLRRRTVLLGVG